MIPVSPAAGSKPNGVFAAGRKPLIFTGFNNAIGFLTNDEAFFPIFSAALLILALFAPNDLNDFASPVLLNRFAIVLPTPPPIAFVANSALSPVIFTPVFAAVGYALAILAVVAGATFFPA